MKTTLAALVIAFAAITAQAENIPQAKLNSYKSAVLEVLKSQRFDCVTVDAYNAIHRFSDTSAYTSANLAYLSGADSAQINNAIDPLLTFSVNQLEDQLIKITISTTKDMKSITKLLRQEYKKEYSNRGSLAAPIDGTAWVLSYSADCTAR